MNCRPASETSPEPKKYGEVPNYIVILLDDMGFGASSSFGGPCEMPTAERLSRTGVRYNQFHTTGICSPSRAALLTGRNHHSVGVGIVTSGAGSSDEPGYSGKIPKSAGAIARILRDNGYATGAFGKMHEQPRTESSIVGPFDRWPTQQLGFEKFYGFLHGSMSHYVPALFDGTTPIDPPQAGEPGYHLSKDIVDQTMSWIDDIRSVTPSRPFFCYLPFGATHAPFHVPREYVEKYSGRFDHGWNVERERILERQKELGVVPPETEMSPWASTIERWDDLTDQEKRIAASLMEVYAGFAEHTDEQVGRLVDYLEAAEMLDNTVIIYILGDNGASAEGGRIGTVSGYFSMLNGATETPDMIESELDRAGEADTWPHFARGWALAMDSPLQWVKQVASHYGGTRTGMVVHWPVGINVGIGQMRPQWHHLIDIAPTLLELAGIKPPDHIDGVQQMPLDGVSMAYSFTQPTAPSTHKTQYFEIGGSRSIYSEGWVACTAHRTTPWNFLATKAPAFEDDVWELYNTEKDFSQAHDLSAEYPEKLAELQELFLREGERFQVLPLDDRPLGARRAARQARVRTKSVTLKTKARRIPQDALPPIFNHTHRVVANIEFDGTAEGVIVSHGGVTSGWALYCKDGILTYCHSLGKHFRHFVRCSEPLKPGRHELTIDFEFQGKALGGPARLSLLDDGKLVATGELPQTIGYMTPAGEDLTVGSDPETPVSPEYAMKDNHFSGRVIDVTIMSGDGIKMTREQELRAEDAVQ